MKILVTGCMGFIGSHVVPSLLNEGHEVLGFDNLYNPSVRPTDRMKAAAGKQWHKFKFFKCDIKDGATMQNRLMSENIDAVVHLAAVGSVPRSIQYPTNTVANNELGFVTLMHVMGVLNIKQLVFASSSSVYGDSPESIRREGWEGKPLSPYALSKKMNEDFARVWAPIAKINYVGLRFFNVYGPGQLPNSPYSAVIPKFINEETPTIFGNGETARDFTFVDDVCEAIKLSLEYTKDKSGLFNVGTNSGTSLNQLVTLLNKKAQYQDERPNDVRVSIASTDHAENVLGFKAKVKIAEGLAIAKAFYESEAVNGKQKSEA